jgi:hypothetical protein
MHNRLIFLYHRVRVTPKREAIGGCLRTSPTRALAGSKGGTQEGSSTQALVVLG